MESKLDVLLWFLIDKIEKNLLEETIYRYGFKLDFFIENEIINIRFSKNLENVYFRFKFEFDADSVIITNVHRKSEFVKKGNATKNLDLIINEIFIPMTKYYNKKRLILIFEIKEIESPNSDSVRNWLVKLGYQKTHDRNSEKWIKTYQI